MARPKKKTADKRDRVLRIRLTKAEKDLFDRAAAKDKLELSSWVRSKLLKICFGEVTFHEPQRTMDETSYVDMFT